MLVLEQNYVLINAQKFATNHNSILLIEKQKPDWQKGRYNLVGGKIELGEDPIDAAQREFSEETGYKTPVTSVELMGVITGNWGTVYCFNKLVSDNFIPENNEIEKVFWADWKKIKDDDRLIPNLRVVIPLMTMGLQNWRIVDNGITWGEKSHTIVVSVLGTTGNKEDLFDW